MRRTLGMAVLWALVFGVAGCAVPRHREPVTDVQVSRKWDRAEELLKAGKNGEALALYQAIAEGMEPNRFTAHAYLRTGMILYARGDYDGAREALIEAMNRDSAGDLKALSSYFLGMTEYRLKEYSLARGYLTAHLELMPTSSNRAEVQETLGEMDAEQGHPLLALRNYSRALDASAADPSRRTDIDAKIAEILDRRLDRNQLRQVVSLYPGTLVADRAKLRLAEMAYLDSSGVAEARVSLEDLIRRRKGEKISDDAAALLVRMTSAPERPEPPTPGQTVASVPSSISLPLGATPSADAAGASLRAVGCVLPLSGRYASYGEMALRGIMLAAGTFGPADPAALGVRWIVKDSRGDPAVARQAIQDLAQVSGAAAAVGPMLSSETGPAAAEADQVGMPIITFSSKATSPSGRRYVLHNTVSDDLLAHALVELAAGELGIRRFATLYPKTADGEAARDLFQREVTEAGGQVVAAEGYDPAATDFAETIAKLIHARKEETRRVGDDLVVGFDALYLPDSAQKVALIAPQLAYHDLAGIQLLGTSRLNTPKLIKMAGAYVQGALFVDVFTPDSTDPRVTPFVQAYRAAYGEPPGVVEALTYDSAFAILKAISRTGGGTRDDLRDSLLATEDLRGVTGLSRFDENGDALHSVQALTVRGEKIAELHWPAHRSGARLGAY